MFSELPKLFDRNFAIAYFLPVSLFLAASTWLLKVMGYWSKIGYQLAGNSLFDATLAICAAWFAGILLMVLNRDIYRFFEGYWKFNPLRLFEKQARKKYRRKIERLDWLDEECVKPEFTEKLRQERTELIKELAEKYPDKEEFVLPTAFGNTLRAFEIYPRVMYGLEGIDGWPRILAILPKEYRELIDDSKSQVDWWVNLSVLSFTLMIEFWSLVFYKWKLTLPWHFTILNIIVPLAIFGLLNWFFAWRASSAAAGWGSYVKSAFDLYRFDLIELLGTETPADRETEKALWKKYSQAIVYRRPDMLPALKKPAARTTKPPSGKAKVKKDDTK
jgi:hypothetical protein